MTALVSATALLLAAGGTSQETDWRRVATATDRTRLRDWRDAWMRSLAAVRHEKGASVIAADPALFDPDAARDDPLPPVGAYRCRVIKFAGTTLSVGGWGHCPVSRAGNLQRLDRTEGPPRFDGSIYAAGTHRGIFLGTVAYPGERRTPGYGRAAGRDMIGLVERIAPTRWRVVLPSPRYESQLDIVELSPDD